MERKIQKTEVELRAQLTPEQYHVTQEKGTERPFTGQYARFDEPGKYQCVVCGADLFDSGTKFDAGCGWPSFWQPLDEDNVETHEDTSLGMRGVEVVCTHCGAHLGHVFTDGPRPTGLRYCMNSASLKFQPREEE